MNKKADIAVIDLFCGIGGLSHGFVLEDFNVVSGYDNDESCRYAFEKNNDAKFHNVDIVELTGKQLKKEFGSSFKILVGCAPCQPFSSYSFRVKEKEPKKVNMLYSFARLVEETNPDIVSMENVPQLMNFDKSSVFQDFYDKLRSLGYEISYEVVYCPDYGIPQKRKRLVLLASKLGKIKLVAKTHTPKDYVTVREAISDLPKIRAGETDTKDLLHRARNLSDLNLKRLKHTKEGGGWKDWPKELILKCFLKKSGRTYGSVYGRMKWNAPAPTMTTHCTGIGNGRFGHPEQNRAISLREAARFQTFPDNYIFFKSVEEYRPSVICRQIGNAVPPKLGQIIARSIKEHLNEYELWQNQ